MSEYGVRNKRGEFRNCFFFILSWYFTRWPELVWWMNFYLARECLFTSWIWQGTSFQVYEAVQEDDPLQVCHESHGQEAIDQVFCLWPEEGEVWKLVPSSVNLQMNILSQGENSPALPALVIMYKMFGKYWIPVIISFTIS